MSVENSNYGLDRGRIMARKLRENYTRDSGNVELPKREGRNPIVPKAETENDKGGTSGGKNGILDTELDLGLNSTNEQGGNNLFGTYQGGYNYGSFTPSAYTPQAFNPSGDTDKERANLNSALASRPADFDYDQYNRILGMMQEYQGREPFSYDLNADMLYQQYKNQYMQNGQRAMQDTAGQVAALNGGYANSYAQTAGQQAYNTELSKLNNVIPELYQLAYSKYAQEGEEMLKGIELANQAYQQRYGEYQDAMSNWRNDVAQARNAYENQRAFDYNAYQDDLTRQQRQKEFDYQLYSDDITRQQRQQQLDMDNYQTALSMAQQNAGNKTTLDATMQELVRRGVIDEATAQNLSGVYGNMSVAETAPTYKSSDYDYVESKIEGYLESGDSLADYLDAQVEKGWISKADAQNLFNVYYPQTAEYGLDQERKMVKEGKHAAYRYIQ